MSAIRQEVSRELQDALQQIMKTDMGSNSTKDKRLQEQLVRGVIYEFHNCIDASRVWTGNWSAVMLMRLQTKLEMHNITKKQCASLR